jgi:prepilin-type N-terminal cleavage/methylation domain-containing protein
MGHRDEPCGEAGFSLLEVVIAAALLACLAAGVSEVFALAVRESQMARVQTLATLLAAQKMEQLRSLTWGYGTGGALLSDESTDLSADPPVESGPGLRPSPAATLDADVPFYVDYLDSAGARVRSRGAAAYTRRWAVRPLPGDPDNVLILQVRVVGSGGGESRLAGLRERHE